MARAGVVCLAFGAEADCPLCGMIDFGHPVTAASLGIDTPPDTFERAEAEVIAHVDRAMRGGWTPRRGTQLYRVARDAGLFEQRADRAAQVTRAAREQAVRDDPPPF